MATTVSDVARTTPTTWAPSDDIRLDAYLACLMARRDAALVAGDDGRVADCEDRIIGCELFLAALERRGAAIAE
jgi:hypothetical protein